MSEFLTIVGLFSDILGVVLLWKYGLPEDVRRDGTFYLAIEERNQEEIGKANEYERLSRYALILLVVGFALQAVGTYSG